ncbi:hypothetical protein ENKNEFLB_02094 [Nocardioides aquaticus]|uniref:Peptidase C51 domain-containing protein n=1 Tax=Nocardioides aquaticus TaxID=160826 RepID=A0ABX8EGR0_9ACTN|nr:CHAP domain-containing protein [Nocardioides aquaticus]QVT79704.1 hypothetical protein ENKNEFLB_02094 [Nocardioides aquaticus]
MATNTPTANRVIAEARKHVGFRETYSGGHWVNGNKFAAIAGHANGYAWCATFVCAIYKLAGVAGLITTPSAGVDQLSVGFKKAGRWSESPAIGAVVFYGTPADLNHTGIVASYIGDTITAIEGNTNDTGSREGNGVYVKTRPRRGSGTAVGYGYPAYPEGIVSADPAWADRGPKGPGAPSTPANGATVNITRALRAKTWKGQAAALRLVTKYGSEKAQKAAEAALKTGAAHAKAMDAPRAEERK